MALALYKANAIRIGEKSSSRYLQYFSIREIISSTEAPLATIVPFPSTKNVYPAVFSIP